jgi:hypothetical protein
MKQKVAVLTTKEADTFLRKAGIGTSASVDESYKQRMITFHISMAPSKVISVVMKVYDRSFEEMKEQPKVYHMGGYLYIVLCHPSINQQDLYYFIQTTVVEVEGEKYR